MNGSPSPSKVLLIADRRDTAAGAERTPIRRFRLARLAVDPRAGRAEDRAEHLRRVLD